MQKFLCSKSVLNPTSKSHTTQHKRAAIEHLFRVNCKFAKISIENVSGNALRGKRIRFRSENFRILHRGVASENNSTGFGNIGSSVCLDRNLNSKLKCLIEKKLNIYQLIFPVPLRVSHAFNCVRQENQVV